MNRGFQVRAPVESGGAPPHSKTLARWLRRPNIRQVLECAAAAALWISHDFHGPSKMPTARWWCVSLVGGSWLQCTV